MNEEELSKVRSPAPDIDPKIEELVLTKQELEKYKKLIKSQDIKIIQLQFDNSIIMKKMEKLKLNIDNKDYETKRVFQNSKDVSLNYNTKSNYVDLLHKKIKELEEGLRSFNYQEAKLEMTKMNYKYKNLKIDFKELQKRYKKVKFENRDLKKIKVMNEIILPKGMKMRLMLKNFWDSGEELSMEDLRSLNLDIHDIYLDPKKKKKGGKGKVEEEDGDLDEENELDIEDMDLDHLKDLFKEKMEHFKNMEKDFENLKGNSDSEKKEFNKKLNNLKMEREKEKIKFKNGLKNAMDDLRNQNLKENFELKEKLMQETQNNLNNESNDKLKKEFEVEKEKLQKDLEEKEIQLSKNEKEIKFLKDKIKKMENKLKKAVNEKNSTMSKIFQSGLKGNNKLSKSKTMLNNLKKGKTKVDEKNSVRINKDILNQMEKDLEEMETLQENLEIAEELVNNLTKDVEQMGDEVEHLEKKNNELEKKIGSNSEERKNLQKNLMKKNTELGNIEEGKKKLKEETLALIKEKMKRAMEIGILKNKNKNMTEKIAELEKMNSEMENDIQMKIEEINELKNNIDVLMISLKESGKNFSGSNFSSKTTTMTKRIIKKKKKKKRVEENGEIIEEKEGELPNEEEFEEGVTDLVENNLNLREASQKKNDHIMNIGSKNEELFNEIQILRQNLAESKKREIGIIEISDSEMKKKMVEINNKFLLNVKEIEHMREEAIFKNEELKDKEFLINRLQNIIEEFEKDKDTALGKLVDMEKNQNILEEIEKIDKNALLIKEENMELKESVRKLKGFNSILEKEKIVLSNKYDDFFLKISEKEKNLKKLLDDNQQLTMDSFYNKGALDVNKKKMDLQVVKIEDIKKYLEKIKKENEDLKNEIREIKKNSNQENEDVDLEMAYKVCLREKEILEKENYELKKQNNEFCETLKENEKLISEKEEELKKILEIKENGDLAVLKRKIFQRDMQIINIIKESNIKTEIIEKFEKEMKLKNEELEVGKKDLDIAIKKISIYKKSKKEIDEVKSDFFMRNRVKYGINIRRNKNEKQELYRLLDEKTEKIEGLRKMLNKEEGDSIDDHPLVKNMKIEILAYKSEIDLKENIIKMNNEKISAYLKIITDFEKNKKIHSAKQDDKNVEITMLKAKYGQSNFVKTDLQKINKELKNENLYLKNDIKELSQNYRTAKQEEYNSKLAEAKLENELKRLKERIEKFKFDLDEKEKELDLTKRENDDLQEELIQNAEDFMKKNQIQGSNKEDLLKNYENLNLDLENLKEDKTKLEILNKKYQEKIDEDKIKYKERLENLNETIEMFKKTNNISSTAFEKFEKDKEIEKNQELINLQKEKILRLENKLENLEFSQMADKSVFSDLEIKEKNFLTHFYTIKQKDHYNVDHVFCKDRENDLKEQVNFLQNENGNLKNNILEYSEKLKGKTEKEKSDILKLELMKKNELMRNLEKNLNDLKVGNEKNIKEKEKILKQKNDYKKKIEIIRKENEDLTNKILKLEKTKNIKEIFNFEKEDFDEQNKKIINMLDEKDLNYNRIINLKDKEIEELKELEIKANIYENKVIILSEENKKLDKEIELEKKKYFLIKNHSDDFEIKYDKIQKEYKILKKNFEVEKKKNISFIDEKEDFEKKIKNLENDFKEKNIQKVADLEILKSREKEIENLKINILQLENILNSDKLTNEEFEKLLKEKNLKISNLEKKLEKLKDVEIQLNLKKNLLLEKESVFEKIKIENFEFENKIVNLKLENKQYSNNLQNAENCLKISNEKYNKSKKTIIDLTSNLESNRNLNLKLKTEIQQLINEKIEIEDLNETLMKDMEEEMEKLSNVIKKKLIDN